MNFLDFKNFDEFKEKMGIDGAEAIILMLNEIEKKARRLTNKKRGENDD